MWPFSSTRFEPETSLPDLTGKVIFVTGANHGIGFATVKHLARRGAKVYLGSRSEERGLNAVAAVEAELRTLRTPKSVVPGKVIYHHCDLSTLELARESAQKLAEKESRLDVLINNAGLPPLAWLTEQMMMVNHFATFELVQGLLPLLIKTSQEPNADVRIISVGSDALNMHEGSAEGVRFKTLEDFTKDYSKDWFATFGYYSISKLANALIFKALQRRVAEHNITCIVLHPGHVNTFDDIHPLLFLLTPIINLFFMKPHEGAYNSCFAAASPAVAQDKKYRGAYILPIGKISEGNKNLQNVELQEEVWESTVRILREGTLPTPKASVGARGV